MTNRKVKYPLPNYLNRIGTKYEDIIFLIKDLVNSIPRLSKILKIPNSTMTDRINRLIKWGYLYYIPGSWPYMFSLSQAGLEYLEIHFTEPLRPEVLQQAEERGIKVTLKTPKTDKFPFSALRFSETLEKYFGKLPKFYPKNPTLLTRPHWITWKFHIQQQSKYLTYHCSNEFGSLAKQNWITVLPMGPKHNPTWFKYHGTTFFNKVKYYVAFSPKNVVVRLAVIFNKDPFESAYRIMQLLFIAKKELEDQYSVNNTRLILGSINPLYIGHCILQHFGIVLTPLSILCDQLGIALEDWEQRLRIDSSNDIPETETISGHFATDDCIYLFEDLISQVKNRYRTIEAHQDIQRQDLKLSKLEHQCLILEDQNTLSNQRVDVIESNLESVSHYLAETTKVIRDSTITLTTQIEETQDSVQILSETIEMSRIIPRRKMDQVLLNFLASQEPHSGFTRNQLARALRLPQGSVNARISELKKRGEITEFKPNWKTPGKLWRGLQPKKKDTPNQTKLEDFNK